MQDANNNNNTQLSEVSAMDTPPLGGRGAVRYATKDDAVLVADLSRQTFYDTFAADNTKEDMDQFLNEQFTRGKLILEVGSPENIFLLAYLNNEVAGYVKLRDGKKPDVIKELAAIEIARLYVVKELIGKGIGKLLMQTCSDIARQKQKEVLWLGVWERNERAIAFYKKCRFEKFGECDFLLGSDLQR